MTKKIFSFQFSGGVDLTEDDIWPDGDGPENPTVDDVKDVINDIYESIFRSGYGMADFIRDWNLEDEVKLNIREIKSIYCREE